MVSSYFLSQLIARHVKVALAGDGADELFGSYLSHRLAQPLANTRGISSSGDPDLIRPFESRPETTCGASLAGDDDWAWRAKLLVYGEEEKRALYAPDVARGARRRRARAS